MIELFDPLKRLERNLKYLQQLTQIEVSVLVSRRRNFIDLTEKTFKRISKLLDFIEKYFYAKKLKLVGKADKEDLRQFGEALSAIRKHYGAFIVQFSQVKDELSNEQDKSFVAEYVRDLIGGMQKEVAECGRMLKLINRLKAEKKLNIVAEIWVHSEYLDALSGLDAERRVRIEQNLLPTLVHSLQEHGWNPLLTIKDYRGRSVNNFGMKKLSATVSSMPVSVCVDRWYRVYWCLEGTNPKRLYLLDIWGVRAPKDHNRFNRSIQYYKSHGGFNLVRRFEA